MDLWIILVVILILVLVWRGPKTLPQLGRAFGRGVREAREEAAKAQAEIQSRTTDPDAPVAPEHPGDAGHGDDPDRARSERTPTDVA